MLSIIAYTGFKLKKVSTVRAITYVPFLAENGQR